MPKAEIKFDLNEDNKNLNITIDTERLHMESVTLNYFLDNSYSSLFGNSANMATFGSGQPWSNDITKQRVDTWVKRWQTNDPYSALAVSKNDDDTFIGHIVLGYLPEQPNSTDLAYVFNKRYWGMGYGKESVVSIVKEYVPELLNKNYKLGGKEPLLSVTATVLTTNEPSIKILKAAGLESNGQQQVSFGSSRYTFFADVKKITQSSIIREEKNTKSFSSNR